MAHRSNQTSEEPPLLLLLPTRMHVQATNFGFINTPTEIRCHGHFAAKRGACVGYWVSSALYELGAAMCSFTLLL